MKNEMRKPEEEADDGAAHLMVSAHDILYLCYDSMRTIV